MKQGRSLTDMAQELDRQLKTRKDFIAATNALAMKDLEGGDVGIEGLNGGGSMPLTELGHDQLGEYSGIPSKYYDRMRREAPGLLAENVNTWLRREPSKRLVRTLDGRVRAFLSDRYRPLDNYDLASVALPIFQEHGVSVVSSELTEKRLYLKATLKTMTAEIKNSRAVGDVVEAGIVLTNSEVGASALRVEPMIYRLRCLNGAILPDSAMRKYHIGGKQEQGDGVYEYLTTETKRADDRAFWMKVKDVIQGSFNRDLFVALVGKIEQAAENKIGDKKIEAVVEDVTEKFGLAEGHREGILRKLIEGADLTRWGVANAITAQSQEVEDYDEATDLERAGGKIIELTNDQWRELAA